MKIKPIASSSAGNCTIIESNSQQLIIDAGIPVSRIRKEIGGFENVVGCLVSHEHGDHAGYIKQLRKQTNVPIFREGHFTLGKWWIWPFQVMPVKLQHDVPCFGFLILTRKHKLFYATDTASIPYTFPGLTMAAIESNFSWDLISKSDQSDPVIQRTINNHLDLDSALDFAERHPDLEELHLLHLSDSHSDEKLFYETAVNRLGIPVYVAPK